MNMNPRIFLSLRPNPIQQKSSSIMPSQFFIEKYIFFFNIEILVNNNAIATFYN